MILSGIKIFALSLLQIFSFHVANIYACKLLNKFFFVATVDINAAYLEIFNTCIVTSFFL